MQRYDMERRFREVLDSCDNLGDIFEAIQIFNHCLLSRIPKIEISRREEEHEIKALQNEIYELKKQLGILPNDSL